MIVHVFTQSLRVVVNYSKDLVCDKVCNGRVKPLSPYSYFSGGVNSTPQWDRSTVHSHVLKIQRVLMSACAPDSFHNRLHNKKKCIGQGQGYRGKHDYRHAINMKIRDMQ